MSDRQSLGVSTISADGVAAADTPVERGTAVERYVVLERIGAGAMGVVYAAFDPRLDRQVAVKILKPRGDRDALLQEARSLAKLSHPNVVAVHDAGVFRDTVFITMERVHGQTLDAWLEARDSRDWRSVLRVLQGAGRGLMAAHDAGSVHRDFKPANVMVDEAGLSKVMDFGLAAQADASAPDARGRPQGTPLYMAPEQYMGAAATFASDQYAFCVVAYEALSGSHPRAGAESKGALLEALSREPPPLSCPGLPTKVRAAILRGLSVDPERRWPSMRELLDVVHDALAGTRSRWLGAATLLGVGAVAWAASGRDVDACAHPSTSAEALLPGARTHDIAAALSTFDETFQVERASVIASEIEHYAEQWAEAEHARCRAEVSDPLRREELAAVASCLQQRRDDFEGAVSVLIEAEGVELVRAVDFVDGLLDPRNCLDGAQPWRAVEPPDAADSDRVAELRSTLASMRARLAVGRWAAVELEANEVVREAQALGYGPLEAEALQLRGAAHGLLHAIDDAERDLSDAAWVALEHGDRRVALLASISQVALRRDITKTEVNRVWAERARRLIQAGSPRDAEAQIDMHLSVSERSVGNADLATKYAKKAAAGMASVHGSQAPPYAAARHVLAAALYTELDHDTALEIGLENLALRERLLGPRHPELVATLLLAGAIHAARGELDEAETVYLRALEIQTEVVGARSRMVAGLYNNLSTVLMRRGLYGDAREAADRAVDIWRELDHSDSLVYGLMSSGGAAFHGGDYALMRTRYDEARAIIEASGRTHPLWASVRIWIGASLFCNGDYEAAKPWLEVEEGALLDPSTQRWQDVWTALSHAKVGNSESARTLAIRALDSTSPIHLNDEWRAKLEAIAGR